MLDALAASSLSACAMRVVLMIGRLQGSGDGAWPSVSAICEVVKADPRTVQRALAEVKAAGFVTVTRRSGKPTIYTVHTPGVSVTPSEQETPGVSVTPGKNAGTGVDAAPTPGVSVASPPAFLSPTPGVSVISHLIQDNDQVQRSETTLSDRPRTGLTPSEAALPLGRLLGGFCERWEKKTGSTWRPPGQHLDRAREVAADYADRPDELSKSLDGFFASSDPFVVDKRWPFKLWLNDPGRWSARQVRAGRVTPVANDAEESTPITPLTFIRGGSNG